VGIIFTTGTFVTLGPITLCANLWLRWCLKQSCSPCWKLFNIMWKVTYKRANWGDSQLWVVGSQIGNLTFGPSFGHNLFFKCPNGSCKPISDICVRKVSQWYKEHFNPLGFDPWNHSLKIWESIKIPIPKVGTPLGVWGFIPSHSLTLRGTWNVTPGLPFGPPPCKPLPWSWTQG
jgi:hypothetical protein